MMTSAHTKSGKALVVDYGGVLTNPVEETIVHFATKMGFTPPQFIESLVKASNVPGESIMGDLERGVITEAEFTQRISKELAVITGVDRDMGDFRDVWFAGRRPNSEFLDYLAGLKSEGYALALLSNNVKEWEPHWRSIVPDGLFDITVISADEGMRKPELAMFELTVERLSLEPQNCLFVDDDIANGEAAQKLGMAFHRFTDTESTVLAIDSWFERTV
ncbi:HAD family hydrolase [Nocardia sp. NPDC055321]